MSRLELDEYGGWTGLRGEKTGFFYVKEIEGRWWLVTPEGNIFLSIGINHTDPDNLKHIGNLGMSRWVSSRNIDIFFARYGSDEEWIRKGLVPDLKAWGFNTLGWTHDAVTRYGHSPSWRHYMYRLTGMPYCQMILFAYRSTVREVPDPYSPKFEKWCDWAARHDCVSMKDDPYLISYFYSDIPLWSGVNWRERSRLTENVDQKSPEAQTAIKEIADEYYRICYEAIRRYDENHLLLGDRYDGNSEIDISDGVLEAMKERVDILSIQFSGRFSEICDNFRR